jgi:hypothetical protein
MVGYVLETVTRLTSTEAQMTMVHRFHVRSSEVSSNWVLATIITIAEAQMLITVSQDLCRSRGGTYTIPNTNISMIPIFWRVGNCSFRICRIGKARIAISRMTWTKIVPKKNFLS